MHTRAPLGATPRTKFRLTETRLVQDAGPFHAPIMFLESVKIIGIYHFRAPGCSHSTPRVSEESIPSHRSENWSLEYHVGKALASRALAPNNDMRCSIAQP